MKSHDLVHGREGGDSLKKGKRSLREISFGVDREKKKAFCTTLEAKPLPILEGRTLDKKKKGLGGGLFPIQIDEEKKKNDDRCRGITL